MSNSRPGKTPNSSVTRLEKVRNAQDQELEKKREALRAKEEASRKKLDDIRRTKEEKRKDKIATSSKKMENAGTKSKTLTEKTMAKLMAEQEKKNKDLERAKKERQNELLKTTQSVKAKTIEYEQKAASNRYNSTAEKAIKVDILPLVAELIIKNTRTNIKKLELEKILIKDLTDVMIPLAVIIQEKEAAKKTPESKISEIMSGTLYDAFETLLDINKKSFAGSRIKTMLQHAGLSNKEIELFMSSINNEVSSINHIVKHIKSAFVKINNSIASHNAEKLRLQTISIQLKEEIEKHIAAVSALSTPLTTSALIASQNKITSLLARTTELLAALQNDTLLQLDMTLKTALETTQSKLSIINDEITSEISIAKQAIEEKSKTNETSNDTIPLATIIEEDALLVEADAQLDEIAEFLQELGDASGPGVITDSKIQAVIDNPDSLLEGLEGVTPVVTPQTASKTESEHDNDRENNSDEEKTTDNNPDQNENTDSEYEDDFDNELPAEQTESDEYNDDFDVIQEKTADITTDHNENAESDYEDDFDDQPPAGQTESDEDTNDFDQMLESKSNTKGETSTGDNAESDYEDDFDNQPPAGQTESDEDTNDFDQMLESKYDTEGETSTGDEAEDDEIMEEEFTDDASEQIAPATNFDESESIVDNEEIQYQAALADTIKKEVERNNLLLSLVNASIQEANRLYSQLQHMNQDAIATANAGDYINAQKKFWQVTIQANTAVAHYKSAQAEYTQLTKTESTTIKEAEIASAQLGSQGSHFSRFYGEIAKNQAIYDGLDRQHENYHSLTDLSTAAKIEEKINISNELLASYQQIHNTETSALTHLKKTEDQPHYSDIMSRHTAAGAQITTLQLAISHLNANAVLLQNIQSEEKNMSGSNRNSPVNQSQGNNENQRPIDQDDIDIELSDLGGYVPPPGANIANNNAAGNPSASIDAEDDEPNDENENQFKPPRITIPSDNPSDDDILDILLESPAASAMNKSRNSMSAQQHQGIVRDIDDVEDELRDALENARTKFNNLNKDYTDPTKVEVAHSAYKAVIDLANEIETIANDDPTVPKEDIQKHVNSALLCNHMVSGMADALHAQHVIQSQGNLIDSLFEDNTLNKIVSAKKHLNDAYILAKKSGMGIDSLVEKYADEHAFIDALAKPAINNLLSQADTAKELGHIKTLTSHLEKYKTSHANLINDNAHTRKTLHKEWDNKFNPLQAKIATRLQKLEVIENQLKELKNVDPDNAAINKKHKQIQEAIAYCKAALAHLNSIDKIINDTRLPEARLIGQIENEIAGLEAARQRASAAQLQTINDRINTKKQELVDAQDDLNNILNNIQTQIDLAIQNNDTVKVKQLEYARNDNLIELTADVITVIKRADHATDDAFKDAIKRAQQAQSANANLPANPAANIGSNPSRTYDASALVDLSTEAVVMSIKNRSNPGTAPTIVTLQRSTQKKEFNVTVNSIADNTSPDEMRELAMKLVETYVNQHPGKPIYISGSNEKLKEEMRAYCDAMRSLVKDPIEKKKYERYPDDLSIMQKISHSRNVSSMNDYIKKAGMDLVHGKNVYSHKRHFFSEKFENRNDDPKLPPPTSLDTTEKVMSKMDAGNKEINDTRASYPRPGKSR